MPITRTFIVDFGSSVIKYGLLQPSATPPSGGGAHTAATGAAMSAPTFYMTLNPAFLSSPAGSESHSALPPIAILPDLIVDALLARVSSTPSGSGSLSSSATAPQLTPTQQLQQQRALMNTLDAELKRALTTAQQQFAKSGGNHSTADTDNLSSFMHSTTATAPSPLLDFHVVLLSSPFVHSFEKRAMLEFLFNLTTLHIPAELCAKLGLEVAAPKGDHDAPPRSRKSGASEGDGLDDGDDNAEPLSNNQHQQGNGPKLSSSSSPTVFLPVPVVISRVHLPNAQETALFSCGEVSATVVDIGPRRTTTITPVVNGSAMARHSVKVPVGGEDIIELTAQQYTACEGFSAADVRRAAAAFVRSEAASTGGGDKLPSSLYAPVRKTLGGGGDDDNDGDEDTIVVAKLKQNALTPIEICERLLVDASLPLALRTMQPSPVVYNCGKMVEDLSKSLQLNTATNPLQSSIPAPTTTVSALLSHINSSSNFKNAANINGTYQGSLASLAASAFPAAAAGSGNAASGAGGGASNINAASETVIFNNPYTAAASSSFLSGVRQPEFAGVHHYQVAASTTNSAIPPIFLMGGASTFPQMRSAFTLVVRRAFSSTEFSADLLPTKNSSARSIVNDEPEQQACATSSGIFTTNAVFSAPLIPFEFTSPLLLLASAVSSSSPLTTALARKSVALAAATHGGDGGDGVNSPPSSSLPPYSLLAPQLRFAFPPANLSAGGGGGSGPSGSAGVGSSSSSSKHSHVLRMAPFVSGSAWRRFASSKGGLGTAPNSQASSSSAALSFSVLASLFGALSPAMVSTMLAPCVGAAIAVQLPSFEEGAITRREYCR